MAKSLGILEGGRIKYDIIEYMRLRKSNNFKKSSIFAPKIVAALIAVILFSNFPSVPVVNAATYYFTQQVWSGSSAVVAVHPANQNNWADYSSVTGLTTVGSISIPLPVGSSTITDDGATQTSFKYDNLNSAIVPVFASTTVIGSGVNASIQLGKLGITSPSVDGGGSGVCAVSEDGKLFCWGQNVNGEVGINSSLNVGAARRVYAGEAVNYGDYEAGPGLNYLKGATSVSRGQFSTCAVVGASGKLYCWGRGNSGLLGDGNSSAHDILAPVRVLKGQAISSDVDGNYIKNIASISVGFYHACALSKDGIPYCWGQNTGGKLGDNTTIVKSIPVRVRAGAALTADNDLGYLKNIASISAGYQNTCAVSKTNGTTYCWGDNTYGQVGDGFKIDRYTPVRVQDGEAISSLDSDGTYLINSKSVSGGGYFNCAVSSSNNATYCWGYNISGQLGNGKTGSSVPEIYPVKVLNGAALFPDSNGTYLINTVLTDSTKNVGAQNCAFSNLNSGAAYCWGRNAAGSFGDGKSLGNSPVPVRVLAGEASGDDSDGINLKNVIDIGIGENVSCFTSGLGRVYCTGVNTFGQLGNGSWLNSSVPVSVIGCTDVDQYTTLCPVGNKLSLNSSFYNSGFYTSDVIDIGSNVNFKTLDFSINQPASTTINIFVRTGNSLNPDLTWTDWLLVSSSGSSIASLNSAGTHRYVQYKAELGTTDTLVSPTLDSLTINYKYDSVGSLISSIYDSANIFNLISGLVWDESVSAGSSATLSLRTAPTTADISSAPWYDFTNSALGCSKLINTVTCSSIPLALRSNNDDRYFQYKVSLTSNGDGTSSVSRVQVQYSINAAPGFDINYPTAGAGGATAYQISAPPRDLSTGKTFIQYSVRDLDSASGAVTPGFITPSFEYNIGSGWNQISSSSLASGDLSNKSVTSTYTNYSATWNAKNQIPNIYYANAQVRVTASDNESFNSTSSVITAPFILDAKNPQISLFNLDSRTDMLSISATDDSTPLEMYISDSSTSTGWITYAASSRSWNPVLSGSVETVSLQVRDKYGNLSAVDAVAPATVSNVSILDASSGGVWREQISWSAAPSYPSAVPLYYQVYRSTDNINYSLISPNISGLTYVDASIINPALIYYYRVVTVDVEGDVSNYSNTVYDQPDGGTKVQFESAAGSGIEPNSTTVQNLKITLSGISMNTTTVSYALNAALSTALSGQDFTFTDGTAIIPAGATSTTISFNILPDSIYENSENFVLYLFNPSNATLGTPNVYTYTINDNDLPPSISFALSASSVAESGSNLAITVNQSVLSGVTTTVAFDISGTATNGSDYTISPSPILISPGSTNALINVLPKTDSVYEGDETIVLTLNSVSTINGTVVSPNVHTVTLQDSNLPPNFSINDVSAYEGNSGTTPFTFTVSLSPSSLVTSTVFYTTQDDTAKAGDDYQAKSGTLVFSPGDTSKAITVLVNGDTFVENDELFDVILTSSTNAGIVKNDGIGTIRNDDTAVVWFTASSSAVSESIGTTALTVNLSQVPASPVSIPYAITGTANASDYSAPPSPLVIPAGQTSGSINVSIVDDKIDEPNETVIVTLGTPTGAALGTPSVHTLTINDNDTAGITVSKSTLSVAEGGATDSYTISFESEPTADVVINLAPDSQLTTLPSSLTFTALNWNIPQVITVSAVDDTLVEGTHQGTIIQTVSSTDLNYNVLTISNVTATITDNDNPNISISPNVSVFEGDFGVTPFIFQVTLSNVSNIPVSVSYTTKDGSAKAPQDYTAATGTIFFAPGETEKIITVYVNGNTVFEPDKTFNVLLSGAVGGNIVNGTGVGTIRNDDQLPVIQFTNGSASGKENVTSFNIPISLSASSLDQVTVNYSVTGGTATPDTDFTLASGTVSIPAGFTNGEILLRIIDDKIKESDETIEITLSNPANAVLGVNTKFVYTIIDDDMLGGVSIDGVRSTIATVSWTSAVEGTSVVEYSATTPAYTSTQVAPGTSLDHKVYLSNLTPATQYFVRVKSVDKNGNEFVDDNSSAGYVFTTTPGPIITAVVPINVSDTKAAASWYTNISSNSYVTYATSSVLEGGIEKGSNALVVGETGPYSHRVDLNNLEPSTTYYFKVKSVDVGGNVSEEINNGRYYSFTTTQDVTPPEIINIAAPVITANSVVVFWQTNEMADGQVEYGIASGVYDLQTPYNTTLAETHTAVLLNLLPETTYYYRIRSKDVLGNIGVSGEQTVKTTAAGSTSVTKVSDEATVAQALYEALQAEYNRAKNELDALLGAKDTTPPVITDIKAVDIKSFSAAISWKTNEPANSYVKYGETTEYGLTGGLSDLAEDHKLFIKGLKMGTTYHFKVSSADAAGNLTSSDDFTFTTLFAAEDLEDLIKVGDVSKFQDQLSKIIESVTPSLVPPVIFEVTVKNITETGATITWRTNVEGSSLVAFASEEEYKPKAENSYVTEMGKSEEKTKEHSVELVSLKSGTKYHFQVKTQNVVGVVGKGRDLIFTTKFGKPELIVLEVKETKASIKWATDKPTTSYAELKDVKIGKTTKIGDELLNRSHIMALTGLKTDTNYEVKGFGYDEKDNLVETRSKAFKTLIDVKAPIISGLKIENALIPTRTDRLQTIILWKTDEPATSQVFYEEGVGTPGAKLSQITSLIETLTTDHVVVLTSFKPSAVYRIQVASTDSSGNKIVSPVQSILTPQKGESIFDIITRNFEQSFGWLKFLQQR